MLKVSVLFLNVIFFAANLAYGQMEGSFLRETWTTPETSTTTDGKNEWFPQLGLGFNLIFPEVIPVDLFVLFKKYFALRMFYAHPIEFNVRVELPQDTVSKKSGLIVEIPAQTINLTAIYGPQYGFEALFFPLGKGGLFISGGLSWRRFSLEGQAQTPLIITPKGHTESKFTTNTEFGLKAKALTTATLLRSSVGWFWNIGESTYIVLSAIGITKPTKVKRSVHIDSYIDAPGTDDDELQGALLEVKNNREDDMENKALKEITPITEKNSLIFGVGIGFRFL